MCAKNTENQLSHQHFGSIENNYFCNACVFLSSHCFATYLCRTGHSREFQGIPGWIWALNTYRAGQGRKTTSTMALVALAGLVPWLILLCIFLASQLINSYIS